jgi:hypothetical protein
MNRLYTQRQGTAHHPYHPQQQCKCGYDKQDGDGDATMRPCDNDGREGCTGDRARESSPAPCSKVFFNNYIRFFTLLTSFYYTGTMTGLQMTRDQRPQLGCIPQTMMMMMGYGTATQ